MKKKIVLMYHDIFVKDVFESGFPDGIQYKVQADIFETHVKAIVDYCKKHENVEVEFTFDDGGKSFLTQCAPILEKYGHRGIFFISTKYLGTKGFLTIDNIKMLKERGHIVGSHTHTHPNLSKLSSPIVKEEWAKSLAILATYTEFGNVTASLPGGYGDSRVIKIANELGVNKLYTSEPITKLKNYQNMSIIGRYAIYQSMTANQVISIIDSKRRRIEILMRSKILRFAQKLLGKYYLIFRQFVTNLRYK